MKSQSKSVAIAIAVLFKDWRRYFTAVMVTICLLQFVNAVAGSGEDRGETKPSTLWAHDNLMAWCVVPWDVKERGPEERAQMLEKLGFKHFAFDFGDRDFPHFDEEIEALQKHHIELTAWWFPFDADDPWATKILETFKRHDVHPQLWVPLFSTVWGKAVSLMDLPTSARGWADLSPKRKREIQSAFTRAWREDLTKTPEEQAERIKYEADRVRALVKLAAPYGSKVVFYNHDGWFGMMENELAVIDRLKELGINDVALVYNFRHARDAVHDDTADFARLWPKIQSHVVAVNITGMPSKLSDVGPIFQVLYPSQGERELNMMKTIQNSGWKGPIGVYAIKGGDAEDILVNAMTGMDWLAAEIAKPGSGGPRPFPTIP